MCGDLLEYCRDLLLVLSYTVTDPVLIGVIDQLIKFNLLGPHSRWVGSSDLCPQSLIFSLYILLSRNQEGTLILLIMEIVPNFYLHPGPFFEPLTPTYYCFLHISGEISVPEHPQYQENHDLLPTWSSWFVLFEVKSFLSICCLLWWISYPGLWFIS